jgi:hypothetical protein
METIYLIAFISTSWYGCNILADVTYNRHLSAHVGLGLVSIISLWSIIPALAIGILIMFIIYSGLILGLYIESKKSKRHA